MTLEDLRRSDKIYLTPAEAAPSLGANPQTIRLQARNDAAKLGFPVVVMGNRVKIPRRPFLEYIGEIEAANV